MEVKKERPAVLAPSCTMLGEDHECVYHEAPPRTKKETLVLCVSGLVAVAVHKKLVPWVLRLLQFTFSCLKASFGFVAGQLRRPQHAATKKEDAGQRGPRTKTSITSFTAQSVSIRCCIRGAEILLSDGVIVRIGRLSIWPPETVPQLALAILLLIPRILGLRLRLLLLLMLPVMVLFRLLLRPLWWAGKGKAIVISLEDVRVSMPVRPAVAKAASESASSEHCEKAVTLSAMVRFFIWMAEIEVRDLRVEIATAKEATKCRGSDDHDGLPDESTPADAAGAPAPAPDVAAGARTIEFAGVRLMGYVSKRSSRLTVSVLRTC